IARAVSIEAQRLANEIKVPLGGTTSANAVVRAMEVSLHSQGRRVRLDAAELSATLDRLSDFKRIGNSFLMADLIYAIVLIGVKEVSGKSRYVAPSNPLSTPHHPFQPFLPYHTL